VVGESSGGLESSTGSEGERTHGNDSVTCPCDVKDLTGGG